MHSRTRRRRLHQALPRRGRRQRWRTPRASATPWPTSTGEDERFHQTARQSATKCCPSIRDPACYQFGQAPDVMGYHTAGEIPNYWTYAKDFVLDDHMFEPVKSWSLPDHLYLVSGWSAKCGNTTPSSCVNAIDGPTTVADAACGRPGPDTGTADIVAPGPTSPGSCTRSTSPGRTTSRPGTSLTAPTTRPRLCQPSPRATDPGHLEPAAHLRGRPEGRPAQEHPAPERLLRIGQGGDPAGGLVDHTVAGRQRAPAR